ncbi:SbcC/MukB-like Walker B domain-containing protein [Streptomyces chrestomyceticus]|uniref:SbcC/MukB-like Walker B domain-containing protein n=1 Tax=Streptomyces chrestomyceticus TaxID=68185 RepID=UPI003680C088
MSQLSIPARWAGRWCLAGAGVENVGLLPREVLGCPSGRILVTGPNGTGKTSLLEKLCPHLLDPTTVQHLRSGKNRGTTLESLMKIGSTGRRRIGYLWLSFRPPQAGPEAGTAAVYYGVRLEYAQGTNPSVTRSGFMMPLVPGSDRDDLSTLSREAFTQYVTGHGGTVFEHLDDYVADLAERVFGCAPGRLQQIARRIKKVRDPDLLSNLTPSHAEQELHDVLPCISPEVLRVTREALAAAEATRARYLRAEKTAARLQNLSSAWLHSCARTVLSATEDALEHTAARQRAETEAESAQTHSAVSAKAHTDLAALVDELDVAKGVAASRAQALARDAASSDVARARETADACETGHRQAEELLDAHASVAADAAGQLEAAVNSVRKAVDSVVHTCAEADVPGVVASPVRMERADQAPVTIGARSFASCPAVTAETFPDVVEGSVAALRESEEHLLQRGANAKMLTVVHDGVAKLQQEGKEAHARSVVAAASADRAVERHRRAHGDAHAKVTALSEAVHRWAARAQAVVRAPQFDLAAIAAQARAWGQDTEYSATVHEAAVLGKRVSSGAAAAAGGARQRAGHHRHQAAAAQQAAAQAAEQARLWGSGKLPALPGPAWFQTADESNCFAVAVDWRPGALPTGPARNAVEAAMAAAGLLSAHLTLQGVASDTGWLVEPLGPELPVEDSLASLLTVVPGHQLSEVAQAVLKRIGYAPTADHPGTTSRPELLIGADGTHRCGPLLARPPQAVRSQAPVASHIGEQARRAAAQREAAAAQRECNRFEQAATRHERTAGRLTQYATSLEDLADQFPHELSRTAAQAEAARAQCAVSEQDARAHACEEGRLAQEKQVQAQSALAQWREQAAGYGLPDSPRLMHEEVEASVRRAGLVHRAAEEMGGVCGLLEDVQRAAQAAVDARRRAELSTRTVLESFGRLSDARATLEACQQRSGMDELALVQEATAAQQAHTQVQQRLKEARRKLEKATSVAAAAQQAQTEAARRLQESRPRAEASVETVRRYLTLGGLAEALAWTERNGTGDHDEEGTWLMELRARLLAVPQPTAGLDECADALRLHLTAAPEKDWHLGHGPAPERMPSHQLSLAGRRMSPHAAARTAATHRAEAQHAYSAADENALENFVLGRLPAAISTAWVDLQDWAGEVNAQMELTAASSGVGVQIDLALRRDLPPSLAAIHHLTCEIGEAERTPEEQRRIGQELLAVMRLGEETRADAAGPGSSRADRLAEAIDIRNWVTVKYMITRPGATRQERWGARGVTVSKGESRLIVLAPMLAALAAEYRDLPSHAARLCALDEVPGDVDDHGRDGIAAYLASLDLDLMSTSHNWDGSPGAWDGIDIFELEEGPDDTVISFPLRVYSPLLQHATGHPVTAPAGT